MTGYGIGEAPLRTGRIVVEVRAVNHRHLDVRVRLPNDSGDTSPMIESFVRKQLERGRVEVLIRPEGDAAPRIELDRQRARDAMQELVALRDEFSPGEPVPITLLSAVPDLFSMPYSPTGNDEARKAVATALQLACNAVTAMRAREGLALAADLSARISNVQKEIALVRARCPEVLEHCRTRLRERVASLLAGATASVDVGRIELEVVLMAEKSDVSEELTRLDSHCAQFSDLVATDSHAPVGRRFDFLLQEMAREANTIGSKSSDVALARAVVNLKAEIERMREQVQNVV